MKAESELTHPWWHCFFARRMGLWQEQGSNNETHQFVAFTRTVRYCMLCRNEYHEGEPIRSLINRALNLPTNIAAVKDSGPPPATLQLVPKSDPPQGDIPS